MSVDLVLLLIAVMVFVGSHFVLSHVLRKPLVRMLGTGAFAGFYAVLAMFELVLMLVAYHAATHGPALWSSNNLVLQVVFDVVSYFAITLFLASLFGNPAMVGANLNGLSTRPPSGVFLITRHPMMFAITIWSLVQMMLVPSVRNAIVCIGLIVLAMVGSRLQDNRKIAQSGREWSLWVSRTRYWPDFRQIGQLGPVWGFALLPWLAVNWIEVRLTTLPVGLWYFFPDLPY